MHTPLIQGMIALCWIADGFSKLRVTERSRSLQRKYTSHKPICIDPSKKIFSQIHVIKFLHHLIPIALTNHLVQYLIRTGTCLGTHLDYTRLRSWRALVIFWPGPRIGNVSLSASNAATNNSVFVPRTAQQRLSLTRLHSETYPRLKSSCAIISQLQRGR